MNRRNASRYIGRVIAEWKKSLPHDVLMKVDRNVIVTGGCIASMLLGEEVNDFDIYLRTKESASALAHHYVGIFVANRKAKGIEVPIRVEDRDDRVKIVIQSAGIAAESNDESYTYFEGTSEDEAEAYVEATKVSEEGEKYRPVFLTQNAVSLSGRVQIITRFFGNPEDIHKNYDFEHCTNYWTDTQGERLVLRPEAVEALLAKELRYQGSLYPVCSVFRIRKFINRGWKINAGQILKMCFQISKLDLTDVDVLEDQLIGVDMAYFREVIAIIRKDMKDGKSIDQTYIAQLVDRVF